MENLKVIGVDCMHCAASVKGALDGVKGVEGIDIQLNDKIAVVSFDPGQISREVLAERIEDVGFDVE